MGHSLTHLLQPVHNSGFVFINSLIRLQPSARSH